jgi:hypothetical protein
VRGFCSIPPGGTDLLWSSREVPVALSYVGSGICVAVSDPAPLPMSHWLRYLCPPKSTSIYPS